MHWKEGRLHRKIMCPAVKWLFCVNLIFKHFHAIKKYYLHFTELYLRTWKLLTPKWTQKPRQLANQRHNLSLRNDTSIKWGDFYSLPYQRNGTASLQSCTMQPEVESLTNYTLELNIHDSHSYGIQLCWEENHPVNFLPYFISPLS